jgi:transcriptional regulator with XRE-family HTH domain
MTAKSIRRSSTVLANLFNAEFDGKGVTIPTVSNWMHGLTMPTQDKLLVLAELLDSSAEQLRYGRHSEKTLTLMNADGSETELTASQQQLVRKYISLNNAQQRLVSDLVGELAG